MISDRKGVNVPDAEVPIPALTEKDRRDLAFAIEHGADWIALSFVQRPEDLAEARELMGGKGALCAKIEKPAGDPTGSAEIIELADGVMVARGDLGVELRPEEVPPLQKRIVNATRLTGKPVIVATQMLESMIESPAPTRAEVSDVANAVYDGADAVMLSAETAAGQWPEEAVMMMDSIARQVERDEGYRQRVRLLDTPPDATTADALAHACMTIADTVAIDAHHRVHLDRLLGAPRRPRTPLGAGHGAHPLARGRAQGRAAVGRARGDDQGDRQLRGDDRQGQAHGAAPRLRRRRQQAGGHGRRAVRRGRGDQPAARRHPGRRRTGQASELGPGFQILPRLRGGGHAQHGGGGTSKLGHGQARSQR